MSEAINDLYDYRARVQQKRRKEYGETRVTADVNHK